MHAIITDDHRYTTKDVIIGAVVFPYSAWVGAKGVYRFVTISSEDRDFGGKCLDAMEALKMPRKSRLRFCDCMIEKRDGNVCKRKILFD
jgi:hypothetical protein